MKRLAVFSLAIALAGAAAGASLAQGGPGGDHGGGQGSGLRQACAADMARLCPDAQPGPGRRECMMSHRDQLSGACRAAVAAAIARHQGGPGPRAPQS